MDDIANREKLALEIGRFIEERKGVDTIVLDLQGKSSWTDFFVISTVLSNAHLQGLLRNLSDFLHDRGIEMQRHTRNSGDTGWNLIDCNEIVVHLMDKERREFYELEKLWFHARLLTHSSKSS